MAGYERKSMQVLGGGFSCLIPGDKTPVTDYLIAQNWRADALGRLISRAGYVTQFTIPGAGIAHSAASAGGADSKYYVACNNGIAVNPVCSVYYDGAQIATGFSGNRVGFASQNGFMWICDREKQGRHSAATGFEAWNILPPGASPTAAAGSIPSVTTSVTYTYAFEGETSPVAIAAGAQTVTPASMTGFVNGQSVGVSNADHSNYEVVTISNLTATTFDAVFTLPHTIYPVNLAFVDNVHSLTIAGVQYSFVQNDNPQPNLPLVIALLAANDPNCSVTYPGSGQNVTITAVLQNTVIQVSGSGGNPTTNLANGPVTSLPSGTYQFYMTFQSTDLTLESNPSAASNSVTVTNQAINVTLPAPTDPRVGFVNIYVTGGTLGQAYRAGQLPSTVASPATVFNYSLPDLTVTNNGIKVPIDNDGGAPAAAGLGGPQWGRLYAWSTVNHPNRLYYTEPNLPQYWPGWNDEQIGNWVDVGLDEENIVWCSFHTNLTVIYKERSIWMLVGDPATGTLEPVYDGKGLVNAFALAPAGQIDYFVAPNGLCLFDMSQVHEISNQVLPLFNQDISNAGPLTPPGSILPGEASNSWNINSTYAVALGHAMGRLYVSYSELGNVTPSYNMLVFDEGPEPERQAFVSPRVGRWFYHRNTIPNTLGFFGFFFDGTNMIGLTGGNGEAAAGYSIADFRNYYGADASGTQIRCVYQSHYEDCGLPDNDKQWLEVAIDFEYSAQAGADVYVGFNNGTIAPAKIGILSAGARRTQSFSFNLPIATDAGVLARNISVLVDTLATGPAVIHNVYLFYYVEARLAAVASTLPTDLGVGKVKECKEMELDIDASTASAGVGVALVSDLPGNALTTRQSFTVAKAGRALFKYPFATTQGFLWQAAFVGAGGPFRLYSARLLMRVIGTAAEAYETTAGFVWDSMEMDLGAPLVVKRAREITLEIDLNGSLTVSLLTDLPGNQQQVRFQGTINGTGGRRIFRIPLPQGTNTAIEGRIYRLQLSGQSAYSLFSAAIDVLPVGVYMEAYEAQAGAVWDSTAINFGDDSTKTFDELRFEMETDDGGTATASFYTDLPGEAAALRGTYPLATGATGRAWITVPLGQLVEGRSARVIISSQTGFRLYSAEARWFRIGRYLSKAALNGNDPFTTLAFDFVTERVKMYKRLEIDLWADTPVNVTVITDQSGQLQPGYTPVILTPNGRAALPIPLVYGLRGRLLRVSLSGTGAARVYNLRTWTRPLSEAEGGWSWQVYPLETSDLLPAWHSFPLLQTPPVWSSAPVLSIDETAAKWTWVDLPLSDLVTSG